MRLFEIDGPVISFLSKMADLMWLNILTLICCIPIFTAGAAITALQYMALKIVRQEENYITKGYFKAFAANFKQSTAMWFLFMIVGGVLITDYRLVLTMDVKINVVVKYLIVLIAVLTIFTFMYAFPLQGKFSNTVRMTIWNGFVFSILQFPKTVAMIVMYVVPWFIIYTWPGAIPLVLVFGLSLPALMSAKLYNDFFQRMEDQILGKTAAAESGESDDATEEEDERIFKDELDETIEVSQND